MTWVRRSVPNGYRKHCCPAPVGTFGTPDGVIGDLWRCDDCGDLWRIGYIKGAGLARTKHLAWRPARWWQRLRHPMITPGYTEMRETP